MKAVNFLRGTLGSQMRVRRTLINLLRELPITMLVSTHDMKLVQELFPRTIVINDSNIVADGLTIEILENEDLLMTKYTQQKRTVRFIDRFSL